MAASMESEPEPESVAPTVDDDNSNFQFGFNLEGVTKGLTDAFEFSKNVFDNQVMMTNLFPLQEEATAVEPTVVAETVMAETMMEETVAETVMAETVAEEDGAETVAAETVGEDIQEFLSVSISMEEEEVAVESVKEEPKKEDLKKKDAQKKEAKKEAKKKEAKKKEAKMEEPKKKRGLFGRTKRQQNDRKRRAASSKLDLRSVAVSRTTERNVSSRAAERNISSRTTERRSREKKQKRIRDDEKREIQRLFSCDTGNEAEEEEAAATVVNEEKVNDRKTDEEEKSIKNTDEEEESRNTDDEEEKSKKFVKEEESRNNAKEDKQETAETRKTVRWNDFAIVGKAQSVVSALARTLEQQDRATQQGNSKRKTKPTETKPILEQDSNAPPDKSQSEMKAFLEQQDSNSLLEKSLITEIEESILQQESNSLVENSVKEDTKLQTNPVPEENSNAIGKATKEALEGQELIFGKDDEDDNTVVSFLTQATGQTKWTRFFSPANLVDEKKESETIPEKNDDNVDKSILASFFGGDGGGDGDADTVVSGLTLASGQTKWTRYFKPAETKDMKPIKEDTVDEKSIASNLQQDGGASTASKQPSIEKKEIEPYVQEEVEVAVGEGGEEEEGEYDDDDAKSIPSPFIDAGGDNEDDADDADTVVSGLTNASGQSKWTRFFRLAQIEPMHEDKDDEKSITSKLEEDDGNGGSAAGSASQPKSTGSVQSCESNTFEKLAEVMNSIEEDSDCGSSSSDSSGSTVAKSVYSSKIRAEDTDFFEEKTNAPSSSISLKSFGGSSKSSKAKLLSSGASVASTPNAGSRSVKSHGGSSISSKAKLPSSGASVASTPCVPSSSRSVKSFGDSSKSSKAELPSSGASVASIPIVPSSSRSVKSFGGSSKAKLPSSGASVASVKSSGSASKASQAELPSSASVEHNPQLPTSGSSVKSSGSASKASQAEFPSSASVEQNPRHPMRASFVMPRYTDAASMDCLEGASSSSSSDASSSSSSNASSSAGSSIGLDSKGPRSTDPTSNGSDSSGSDSSGSDDSEDETCVSEMSSKASHVVKPRWWKK